MAVELRSESKCIICYDYKDFEIDYSTEGILTKIDPSLGEMIEEQYHIKLFDYGVSLYDECYTQEIAEEKVSCWNL
jgi:hypothetical protein